MLVRPSTNLQQKQKAEVLKYPKGKREESVE